MLMLVDDDGCPLTVQHGKILSITALYTVDNIASGTCNIKNPDIQEHILFFTKTVFHPGEKIDGGVKRSFPSNGCA